MEAKLAALQKKLNAEVEALKAIQRDVQKNHSARQQFTQQKNENDMVLKELELADEESKVYKLIGPTLIRQDPVEAKSNVQKRLEFITSELDRLDSQLKAHENKAEKRQQQVMAIQSEVQRMQQAAANPG